MKKLLSIVSVSVIFSVLATSVTHAACGSVKGKLEMVCVSKPEKDDHTVLVNTADRVEICSSKGEVYMMFSLKGRDGSPGLAVRTVGTQLTKYEFKNSTYPIKLLVGLTGVGIFKLQGINGKSTFSCAQKMR